MDLKDPYFAIPIYQSHHQYLRFRFQGKCYQFQCLRFGLSSAPWVFTKTLKTALAIKLYIHLCSALERVRVFGLSQLCGKCWALPLPYLWPLPHTHTHTPRGPSRKRRLPLHFFSKILNRSAFTWSIKSFPFLANSVSKRSGAASLQCESSPTTGRRA